MTDSASSTPASTTNSEVEPIRRNRLPEDWLAVVLAVIVITTSLVATYVTRTVEPPAPAEAGSSVTGASSVVKWANPLKDYLATPAKWISNPLDSLTKSPRGILGAFAFLAVVFSIGMAINRGVLVQFVPAFTGVFLLATLSYLLAEQDVIKGYGLEYALWALLIGLLIGNTVGTPGILKPAVRTELYIKVGLVLLGAEVLFGQLLALGLPGICIAWIVTPIVLITTFWFGQKILKIESPSLNMVISADMSVCGVSAAIATAAACKAKKEELSTAIGISLAFTVVMMIVQPMIVQAVGLDPVVGGAWIGGTIDSTGAVGAAGAMLGKEAEVVATTVKMIQNMLIGVVAFGVAVYWVTYVERTNDTRPDVREIWRRFPRFILGFVCASILVSLLNEQMPEGATFVKSVVDGGTKIIRNWCFCLAFVSIGLETDFRSLARFFAGGKPLTLYVCGQALNLILSLLMSILMFKVVFPGAAMSSQSNPAELGHRNAWRGAKRYRQKTCIASCGCLGNCDRLGSPVAGGESDGHHQNSK